MQSFVVYSSVLPTGRTEFRAYSETFAKAKEQLKVVCENYAAEIAPNNQVFFVQSEETCDVFSRRVKYDDKMGCGMYFLVRGSEVDAFHKTWDVGYLRTARYMQHLSHLGIMAVPFAPGKPVLVPVNSVAKLDETQSALASFVERMKPSPEHQRVMSELERVIAEFEARRENRLGGDKAYRPRKEDEVAMPIEYAQSNFVTDLVQQKQLLRQTEVQDRPSPIPLGKVL